MAHDFTVDERKARLSVRLVGPGSYEDARTTVPRMLRLCSRHKLTSILLDISGVKWHPDDFTLYRIGCLYQDFAAEGTRIAVVRGNVPEAEEFFGVAARDHGAEMRVFATMAEAEKWLDESPGAAAG